MTAAVGTIFPLMCPEDGRISLLRKADTARNTHFILLFMVMYFLDLLAG